MKEKNSYLYKISIIFIEVTKKITIFYNLPYDEAERKLKTSITYQLLKKLKLNVWEKETYQEQINLVFSTYLHEQKIIIEGQRFLKQIPEFNSDQLEALKEFAILNQNSLEESYYLTKNKPQNVKQRKKYHNNL